VRIVFLGPPGAGKGTQAQRLSDARGWLHLSTGDILRDAIARGTETGRRAKGFMDEGRLVPDEVVDRIVAERLERDDAASGWILDGYPRTTSQAEALDRMLAGRGESLDAVLFLDVDDEELVRRILGRAEQGGGRADDSEDVARERLRVYREHTEPLVARYESAGLLRRIDGTRSIDEVAAAVLDAVQGGAGA